MERRGGRARGAAHPGLGAGGRALAGAPAGRLRAGGGCGDRVRALPRRGRMRPRRCASSSSAGSPRSRPTGARGWSGWHAERTRRCRRSSWSAGGASSPTPTPAWRGPPGSACRFARSPTPRTGCSRSTCSAPATPRRSCPRPPSSTPTTTRRTEQLRRCFDEWRGLREVYGWREPASPAHLLAQLRGELGQAREALIGQGVPRGRRCATLAAVSRHHVVARAGALLGSRADRLPAASEAQAVARGSRGLRAARPGRRARCHPPTTLPHR